MNKPLFIILIVVVGIIEIAVHGVFGMYLYKTYINPQGAQAQSTVQTPASSLKEETPDIREKLAASESLAGYSLAESESTTASGDALVFTASSEFNSPLGIQPNILIQVSRSNSMPFDAASLTDLKSAMTTAMGENELNTETLSTPREVLASFGGSDLHCSLTGTAGAPFVSLACATNNHVTTSESVAKQLASLQDAPVDTVTYTTFKAIYTDSNDRAVAQVEAFDAENIKLSSFVFTLENNDWTYVDDAIAALGNGGGGGKIASSPKIDEVLSDDIYGPLYLELLGAKNPQ